MVTIGDETRRWVGDALEAPVVAVRPLTGGVASRMLLVRVEDGREAVLRQLVDDPWRTHAEPLLRRERDVHGLLEDSAVPTPSTIALDVRGDRTDGDPSLLMTRLPGAVDLVVPEVDALAAALLDIHAVRPGPGGWPREYESWAFPAKRVVPPWSRDDGCLQGVAHPPAGLLPQRHRPRLSDPGSGRPRGPRRHVRARG